MEAVLAARIGRLTLWGALLVGAWLVFREGAEQQGLRAEYQRLRATVGELTVTNPEMIHVTALETEDPLYFVWRVYLPREQTYQWQTLSPHGSSHGTANLGTNEPQQGFIRCRLRVVDGQIQKYVSRPGGSSYSTFGDADVARLLERPAEQLRVEQLGLDGPVVVGLNEVTTLLRLEYSDEFREEILAGSDDPHRRTYLEKPLVVFRFGTEQAFAVEEEPGAVAR
jgi:hypothetical protein